MSILDAVEFYLEKKGKPYDPDTAEGNLNLGLKVGADIANLKIFLTDDNILHFRTILTFKVDTAKARGLIVAANIVNGYINFGKFVVKGNGIYFDLCKICSADDISDKDIAFYLTASRLTAKKYLASFVAINEGELSVQDFIKSVSG